MNKSVIFLALALFFLLFSAFFWYGFFTATTKEEGISPMILGVSMVIMAIAMLIFAWQQRKAAQCSVQEEKETAL